MRSDHWLSSFLNDHINSSKPDGRPLYAYKCKEESYSQLKALVRELFSDAKIGFSPNYEPIFCLFAAETWRRRHGGGSWKWETIFNEINKPTPSYSQLYEWVQKGLEYWERPILQVLTDKKNLYLVTIACEGGLPLLLLQKENAHLTRYFRQLLQTYHHEKNSADCDAVGIAKRLASHLPKSLRHEIVYNLGGNLVQQVVDLQRKVVDAIDPIVALDKNYPDWRDKLPLPVRDSTVELLLKNLVDEAKVLTLSEKQRIRWRRLLIKNQNEWQIEQRLDLPKQFSGAMLQKWLNKENLAPRLRILIQTENEITPVALLTRLQGEGAAAVYRCEILKQRGICLSGAQAVTGVVLLVSDGKCDADIEATGGEALGPLPWIFRERDGQWEYLREGSTRCKEDQVMVLAPSDGDFKSLEGTCAWNDDLPEIERVLYQCKGTVHWFHRQLDACRIACNCQDVTDEILSLEGRRFYIQTDSTPIFLGLPNIYAISPEGDRRLSTSPTMQWRPYAGCGLTWRDKPDDCLGDVWIRYLDKDENQLLRRRVRVVPQTVFVRIDQLGLDQTSGRLCLGGLSGGTVNCIERDDCKFDVESVEDVTFIRCLSDTELPAATFIVRLQWTEGRALELRLPFPQLGGAFSFSGNILQNGDRVPVTRLAGVQAIAHAPLSNQAFDLNITIKCSRTSALNGMWLQERFVVEKDGRGVFCLHRLQEKIASLLALTGELDAKAVIEILKSGGRCMARLRVSQFDMLLVPNKENRQVFLNRKCLERLEEGWENRVSIRMVPLWDPDREPVILEKTAGLAAWDLPDNLAPGPWWVLGEDGDWPRFRPLLWSEAGEEYSSDSPLERAIRQDEPETRSQMYLRWAEEIAMDPNHPDWIKFFSLLKLVRPYPASALDLFPATTQCAEVMVMALLQSQEEEFETIWSLSSQLPFSWYLLPVNAWHLSVIRYFGPLKMALAEIDSKDEFLWETFCKIKSRVTSQRPFFRQICDWICHSLFPEKTLQNSELNMARNHPEMIDRFISDEEQNFQGRHPSDERFPDGPQIMRWTEKTGFPEKFGYKHVAEPFRPVRCAPFVAAHISLEGQPYDENLLFELKIARDFDPEWFNAAYAFSLCLGLSKIMASEKTEATINE